MYILWIRHGFSCANYLKFRDPMWLLTSVYENDAPLTNMGQRQIEAGSSVIFKKVFKMKKRSKKLNIVPIFFTSILTRAIETADSLKKGPTKKYKIIIVPYVEEISRFPWLTPFVFLDKQNQPRYLDTLYNDINIPFNVYDNLSPYDEKGRPVKTVSVKNFFEEGLPTIMENLKNSGVSVNSQTTIVVVSHRKTIKEATGHSIGNGGAVLQHVKIKNDNPDDNTESGKDDRKKRLSKKKSKSRKNIFINAVKKKIYIPGSSELITKGFTDHYDKKMVVKKGDVDRCRRAHTRSLV
jgi:broad specificity phosphatase PhoE